MACQQSKTSVMNFLRLSLWLRLWPCGSTLCGTRRDSEQINEAAVVSLLELLTMLVMLHACLLIVLANHIVSAFIIYS